MRVTENGIEARIVSVDTQSMVLEGPFDGERLVLFRPGHTIAIVDADALQRELADEIKNAFEQGEEEALEDAEREMESLRGEVDKLRKQLAASEQVTG